MSRPTRLFLTCLNIVYLVLTAERARFLFWRRKRARAFRALGRRVLTSFGRLKVMGDFNGQRPSRARRQSRPGKLERCPLSTRISVESAPWRAGVGMKLVLRKPGQFAKALWPDSCWRLPTSPARSVPLSSDFKEEADCLERSAIGRLLASTPDGSKPVNRQQRDYNTCATMSTSNLTCLT